MSGRDPLFIGATRPSLVWGVTYEALILCVSSVMILFIGSKNPFFLFLYIPAHGICYLVTLKDPRFFKLLMLWTQTKGKSIGWQKWRAATATPFKVTRNKRDLPDVIL